MVECNLAELVDDDRAIGQLRALHQPVQQRRLAAAEKAGDQRHRQSLGRAVGVEQAAHNLDIVAVRSDSFHPSGSENTRNAGSRSRREGGTAMTDKIDTPDKIDKLHNIDAPDTSPASPDRRAFLKTAGVVGAA